MLPWYLRPIRPSRFAFLGPPLFALFFLAFGGISASFLAHEPPNRFPGPMFTLLGVALSLRAAWGFVRQRREGGRCPGFSVWGVMLGGAALIVMGIPSLLWPDLPRGEPVPSVVVTTQQVCWWLVGVLAAGGSYAMTSHHHRPSEPQPS